MSLYDRWESRFSSEEYLFGTAPNAFLTRQADLLRPGMTALAVSDGEGRNGVWLAEQGLDVLSLDFSPAAQKKARKLADARKVTMRFELADIFSYDWPAGEYDVIAAIFIQYAPPAERTRIFDGMKRALKPGGLLLIEGYGLKQLEYRTGGPDDPDKLYTPAMLEDAFADLSSVEISAYDAEVDEGAGHSGMSSLVDLVGRK